MTLPEDDAHRFPCESCGSDMVFDPPRGALVCRHCGRVEDLAATRSPWAVVERDYRGALAGAAAETTVARTLRCPNCGAEVILDPAMRARDCPFCATPAVAAEGPSHRIKPAALLPFALDEEAAHAAMRDWLGRLWFAPNGLARYARRGRRMTGIYLPYWTFDAATASRYTGQRGIVRHVARRVGTASGGATRSVAEVRWHRVSGRVARRFDDVLVLASTALPASQADGVAPWDLSGLVPYAPEFLSGFGAETYGVGLEDGFAAARLVMDAQIARDVRFDIGGDRQRISGISTEISEVTFKHVLLPVWLAAYRYRGRSFNVAVNGATGRVSGARPYSWPKIALAAICVALVAGLAGYLYGLTP